MSIVMHVDVYTQLCKRYFIQKKKNYARDTTSNFLDLVRLRDSICFLFVHSPRRKGSSLFILSRVIRGFGNCFFFSRLFYILLI